VQKASRKLHFEKNGGVGGAFSRACDQVFKSDCFVQGVHPIRSTEHRGFDKHLIQRVTAARSGILYARIFNFCGTYSSDSLHFIGTAWPSLRLLGCVTVQNSVKNTLFRRPVSAIGHRVRCKSNGVKIYELRYQSDLRLRRQI